VRRRGEPRGNETLAHEPREGDAVVACARTRVSSVCSRRDERRGERREGEGAGRTVGGASSTERCPSSALLPDGRRSSGLGRLEELAERRLRPAEREGDLCRRRCRSRRCRRPNPRERAAHAERGRVSSARHRHQERGSQSPREQVGEGTDRASASRRPGRGSQPGLRPSGSRLDLVRRCRRRPRGRGGWTYRRARALGPAASRERGSTGGPTRGGRASLQQDKGRPSSQPSPPMTRTKNERAEREQDAP